MAAIEGVGTEIADTLFKLGWRSAADVAGAKPEELSSVAGIGNAEAAKRIISAAARAAEVERKQHAEEMARLAQQAEQEAAAASERSAAAAAATATATGGEGGAIGRPTEGP